MCAEWKTASLATMAIHYDLRKIYQDRINEVDTALEEFVKNPMLLRRQEAIIELETHREIIKHLEAMFKEVQASIIKETKTLDMKQKEQLELYNFGTKCITRCSKIANLLITAYRQEKMLPPRPGEISKVQLTTTRNQHLEEQRLHRQGNQNGSLERTSAVPQVSDLESAKILKFTRSEEKWQSSRNLCVVNYSENPHLTKAQGLQPHQVDISKFNVSIDLFVNSSVQTADDALNQYTQLEPQVTTLAGSRPISGARANVLFTTATVDIPDKFNSNRKCRIILDPGSQVKFTSANLSQQLKPKCQTTNFTVDGINKNSQNRNKESQRTILNEENEAQPAQDVLCSVMQMITKDQSNWRVNKFKVHTPGQYKLTEPKWQIHLKDDMLIGGATIQNWVGEKKYEIRNVKIIVHNGFRGSAKVNISSKFLSPKITAYNFICINAELSKVMTIAFYAENCHVWTEADGNLSQADNSKPNQEGLICQMNEEPQTSQRKHSFKRQHQANLVLQRRTVKQQAENRLEDSLEEINRGTPMITTMVGDLSNTQSLEAKDNP
ncbi:uncharacterized protein LOC129795543 [Lutzomyia longipalpis]|uniref:uncharacterized protein LOC129795543 n=1 Tax=Lutzomyia longipalpis TaxID=7200 RepID=UPI002483650C|nr:uncharacterized protein LOC129795543 [Lutzomyia longipalpis]